jgi:hypothetical protein
MAREGKAPPPAYIALGMLVERLREQQTRARDEFAERFEEFSRKGGRKRWKRVLAKAAAVPESRVDDAVPPDREGRRG